MPRRREQASFPEAWDDLKADYRMSKSSRFRRSRSGVSGTGRAGDYHIRNETGYMRMMEEARAMDRDDAIVGQTIDRAVINTVQDGITADPQTGDAGADKELSARWLDYTGDPEQCDLQGEMTHGEMCALALRHTFVDGDLVGLLTRDGPVQLVEGHRVRTPKNTKKNVVLGVLLNQYRRRQQYWITKDDIDPLRSVQRVGDMNQYPVRNADGERQVLHVYNRKRVSQTRGITAFAPIVDVAAGAEDVHFAKIIQAQVTSCFAIFRERALEFLGGGSDPQRGARTTETQSDGSTRTIEGYAPGMEFIGKPGEKLHGFSPNVPNPEFFPHIRLLLQIIGVNLGLPLVMVLLDASETNFSGWRGAVDQARLGFRANQRMLINRFQKPDYRRKVRQWMAEDAGLRAAAKRSDVNLFGVRFNTPAWPYVDPFKDASADLLRRRNAGISQRRWAHERGMDWNQLSTEIVEDNAELIEKAHQKAEELNQKYPGLGVTWREVASLPTPDGVKISLSAGAPEDQNNAA